MISRPCSLGLAALSLTLGQLPAQTTQRPVQVEPRRPEALTLTIGPSRGQQAAQEIAEAERAFAKLGREKGTRDAFVTWLGPDGLTFEPGPTKVAEVYPKRPEAKSILLWGPDEVGASADGSMGFSSGPYILRAADAKPEDPGRHGRFLSVWKRAADGQWKVALDFGGPGGPRAEVPAAGTEVAIRFTGFATPRPAESRREATTTQSAFFRALEGGDWKTLRTHLHDQFRVSWNPTDGFVHGVRLTDETWPALAPKGSRYEVTSEVTAEAGDFAYSHGRIVNGEKVEGYWMSVWVREAQTNRWQLVRLVRNKA